MKEIFKEIFKAVEIIIKEKGNCIEGTSICLQKENFHEISEAVSKKKIAFVDGGNAELISAPNLSVQLIRLYSVIYENNKRLKSKKYEFYVVIGAKASEKNVKYST